MEDGDITRLFKETDFRKKRHLIRLAFTSPSRIKIPEIKERVIRFLQIYSRRDYYSKYPNKFDLCLFKYFYGIFRRYVRD